MATNAVRGIDKQARSLVGGGIIMAQAARRKTCGGAGAASC